MKRTLVPLVVLVMLAALAACGGGEPPRRFGSISGSLVYPGSMGAAARAALPLSSAPVVATARNDLGRGRAPQVVPGEVLVFLAPDARAQAFDASAFGMTAVRALPTAGAGARLMRAEGLDQAGTVRLAERVAREPGVVAAFPNWVLHAFKTPDDEHFPLQWHYGAMNLPAAWDSEDGSSNAVTVAVVDSGYVAHPDLVPNLLPGYDFISDPSSAGDGDGRDADPWDEGGESGYHGTHVAGTVAAATDNATGVAGVSWGAKVVPVRVLGVTGNGSTADILDGTAWAAGKAVPGVPANVNPARVINLSLGGDLGQPCPAELGDFFTALADEGTIVVVAAGNDNVDAATTFPASCAGVITVGATGPANTRAPYSNYGAVIDVMAAGGDVTRSFQWGGSTYPAGVLSTLAEETPGGLMATYAFYQGTSMASPHVAGIAALMLSRDPGLGFADVRDRLKLAATPLDAAACERPSGTACGAGLVDAAKALVAGGTPPEPPGPPTTTKLTTYVAALYCDLGCYDFDLERSKLVEVEVTSSVVPYVIGTLEPGVYVAAAWQDLDRDGEIDDGEPFGVFGAAPGGSPITVQAGEDKRDVIIVMTPLTLSDLLAPNAAGSRIGPLGALERLPR